MRRVVVALAIGLLLDSTSPSTLHAQLQRFSGAWSNISSQTRTLTRLRVDVVGPQVTIHAWGKCVPQDCDWGAVDGVTYGPSIHADPIQATRALLGSFVGRGRETLLVIHFTDNDQLDVEIFARYTDRSGRSNVNESAAFQRANGT